MNISQEQLRKVIAEIQGRHPHIGMFEVVESCGCVWLTMQLFKQSPGKTEIPEVYVEAFEDKNE